MNPIASATNTSSTTTTSTATTSPLRSPPSSLGPLSLPRGEAGVGGSSSTSPITPPSPSDSLFSPAASSLSGRKSKSSSRGSRQSTASAVASAVAHLKVSTSPKDAQEVVVTNATTASALSLRSTPSSDPSTTPPRVVYGCGTIARLPAELGRLHLSSPLIVSSPSRIGLARRIQALIPNLDSRILDSAVVNVPARVIDDVLERISGRDAVISIGGASAVGLAKVIGCRKAIPHICIPTTYSGSEMMPLLLDASPARHSSSSGGSSCSSSSSSSSSGRSRHHDHKSSRRESASNTSSVRDPRTLPAVIIYDEELTLSPSKTISAPSDSAAMAQSTELRSRPSKGDETAQWSYIHLPGV
ncbi:hypothetical protein HIM_05310 [Hirsutella minnesotensis 3608]|uniref:Alcohol dehydrogenase iron-type/glycerol dehydrogenase GldA domain-containing protein n=1 Tax=Hirsutella minnesotensis 3608 TaxID=1043627 RepID=A0A0F8A5I4_9HYPO|nr:hypothetical protein HIM_05310 [Hirsutella minnesotensis 3608]